jgi:DNA-binding NarL/FixJ family response regulator
LARQEHIPSIFHLLFVCSRALNGQRHPEGEGRVVKAKTRVFLVDSHPLIRDGLRMRIHSQSDLEVCGEAGCAADAVSKIAACRPDLVTLELVFRDSNGLDLIEQIRRRFPAVRLLVVSMQDESLYAPRALAAGAAGYVGKHESSNTVVDAIRCVLHGDVFLSEPMKMVALSQWSQRAPHLSVGRLEGLSNRSLEVYRLLGEGLDTRQIAGQLHVSIKTVESYYERIKIHLRVDSLRDLTRHALLWRERPQSERDTVRLD